MTVYLIRTTTFLAFDLMYLGMLIAFFNYLHLIFVLYAVIMLHLQILQEERYLTHTFGEKYTQYQKRTGRYFIFDRTHSKKKTLIIIVSIILSVSLAVGGLAIYACHQLSKLPNLTFKEALAYTTQNNPDAVISVDVIKDGEMSYTVYGKNGVELPADLHTHTKSAL